MLLDDGVCLRLRLRVERGDATEREELEVHLAHDFGFKTQTGQQNHVSSTGTGRKTTILERLVEGERGGRGMMLLSQQTDGQRAYRTWGPNHTQHRLKIVSEALRRHKHLGRAEDKRLRNVDVG